MSHVYLPHTHTYTRVTMYPAPYKQCTHTYTHTHTLTRTNTQNKGLLTCMLLLTFRPSPSNTQDSQVNQHAAKNAEWDRDPCHARSLRPPTLHLPKKKKAVISPRYR